MVIHVAFSFTLTLKCPISFEASANGTKQAFMSSRVPFHFGKFVPFTLAHFFVPF